MTPGDACSLRIMAAVRRWPGTSGGDSDRTVEELLRQTSCAPFHRTHSGSSAFAATVTGSSGIQSAIRLSRYGAR